MEQGHPSAEFPLCVPWLRPRTALETGTTCAVIACTSDCGCTRTYLCGLRSPTRQAPTSAICRRAGHRVRLRLGGRHHRLRQHL